MLRRVAIGLAALLVWSEAAPAQDFPSRIVTIVSPYQAGGTNDIIARILAQKLGERWGKSVIIENKPGANGGIGITAVTQAAPDGYTLLAATAGTHVTAVHLMKQLPYDPLKDFAPIVAAVEPVTCLAVHSAVPVDTVEELIAYARSHPDELSYGSSGLGSVFHMMGELFNQTAGVRIKHVPYRGVAPAMQDVISGHIPMVFISVSNAIPAMQTGRVKILAVLEPTRYPKLSQVRSMSEIVSAFQKPSSWFGFFGPAGLPREIVTRLNIEMVKSLNASDVRGKLEDNGMTVIGGTPEQFGALMQDGIVRYGAIIKATGIQAE